ncbi:MAG: hypothetical protein Q4D81_11765 [Eubacteriales bacterium]|nr:hypothetical protein [Eubacteriales bacterium]
MIRVIKKEGKIIHAYRLGDSSPVLDRLIAEGKIIPLKDGGFEVLSREALLGGSGHGQVASRGDYIKLDTEGCPYPNSAVFFEAKHKKLDGDMYEQLPEPMDAWTAEEATCPEIEFLLAEKGLTIHPGDSSRYFSAPLWGTVESAPADAVIIFYSITHDESGNITDADFNFVVREEFEKLYNVLPAEAD